MNFSFHWFYCKLLKAFLKSKFSYTQQVKCSHKNKSQQIKKKTPPNNEKSAIMLHFFSHDYSYPSISLLVLLHIYENGCSVLKGKKKFLYLC